MRSKFEITYEEDYMNVMTMLDVSLATLLAARIVSAQEPTPMGPFAVAEKKRQGQRCAGGRQPRGLRGERAFRST